MKHPISLLLKELNLGKLKEMIMNGKLKLLRSQFFVMMMRIVMKKRKLI
jgi:hypothetical protein